MFTPEELKNIAALINLASIKGEQALTVAMLQQKIIGLLSGLKKEEKQNKSNGENKQGE